MDQNRLLIEAELKALMEVSQDFARGLSTVAARMKVLKSCLDKQPDGHVSRVDRATSPIVFRTDRGTSVSPLRFKSPVKIKEEKVDFHDEIVTNVPEKRNNCDITISQTQSISVNSYNENRIDFPQKRKLVATREEQLMESSRDVTSPGAVSGASTSSNCSQDLTIMPLDSSLSNLRKSYYVVNPINGLAIPIDVSQINELGLTNNPVQQITLQHNQPIEEDILYAMQTNQRNNSIARNNAATVGTAEEEILLSSGEENELVRSDKVFAARLPPLSRNHGVKKKTNEEIREYNRLRQARYRANQQRRFKESIERDKQKALQVANNLNSILNSDIKKGEPNTVSRNVLILRKDLIKKTYARGHRQSELQMNGTASRETETS